MITFDELTENVIFCCIIRGFTPDYALENLNLYKSLYHKSLF